MIILEQERKICFFSRCVKNSFHLLSTKRSCLRTSIKYKIFFRFALLFNEIQNQFAKTISPFPQPSKKACHFMTNIDFLRNGKHSLRKLLYLSLRHIW